MSVNKLNITSKTAYEVEVNNNGDTIVLDFADISFYSKLKKCLADIDIAQKELLESEKETNKLSDEKITPNSLSKKDEKKLELMLAFFDKGCEALDEVFGIGASEKIFQGRRHFDMFEQLLEQLEPHFEKARAKAQENMANIEDKYLSKNNTVLK